MAGPAVPERVVVVGASLAGLSALETLRQAGYEGELIAVGAAHAEGLRDRKDMSLELATQIAAQAVATCSANGYAVSATVVDRAGTVRAVQRADGSGPHTIDSRRQKAYTAASAREAAKPAALRSSPRW